MPGSSRIRIGRKDDEFSRKLETEEFGPDLEQLYPDEDAEWEIPPVFQADIVLVHGLGGHHRGSWEYQENGRVRENTLWPKDLLPKHVPDLRVFSFKYTNTLVGAASTAGIKEHAESLIHKLYDKKEDDKKEDDVNVDLTPIVFVGHSLGGHIIKQALSDASKDPKYKRIWEASRGIMFFSTPHYGLDPWKWRLFVRRVLMLNAPVVPFSSFRATPTENMLKEVHKSAGGLVKISEDFEPLWKYFAFQSFVEGQTPQGSKDVIVDLTASRLRAPTEHHQMLRGDHMGVCKFSKDDLEGDFVVVSTGIKDLINQEPKEIDSIGRHGKRVLYSLCTDQVHLQPMARKPAPGTCNWIKDDPAIQKFFNVANIPEMTMFWILGPPACGKSYLARHIISEIGSSSSQDIIYCFISKSTLSRSDANAVLQATMQQALRLEPKIIKQFLVDRTKPSGPEVKDMVISEKETWSPEKVQALWPTIMAQMAAKRSVIGVIDGVEELPEKGKTILFDCITSAEKQSRSQNTQSMKWLFLSRQLPASSTVSQMDQGFSSYQIPRQKTDGDIANAIAAELGGAWSVRGLAEKGLQNTIINTIKDKANGNFLMASLIAQQISRNRAFKSEQDILTVLEGADFPNDLAGTYKYVIREVSKPARIGAILKYALWWAAFQYKGLKPEEFNIAQAVGRALEKYPTVRELHEGDLQEFLDDNIAMTLNMHCGHLVKFQAGCLELVHDSFRGYLSLLNPKEAHDGSHLHPYTTLANTCIAYLTMRHFRDSGPPPETGQMNVWESKVWERVKEHKFLRYASLHWHDHLRDSGEESLSPYAHERRQLLDDREKGYSICWTETWWYYNMWPGKKFPQRAPVEQVEALLPPRGKSKLDDEQDEALADFKDVSEKEEEESNWTEQSLDQPSEPVPGSGHAASYDNEPQSVPQGNHAAMEGDEISLVTAAETNLRTLIEEETQLPQPATPGSAHPGSLASVGGPNFHDALSELEVPTPAFDNSKAQSNHSQDSGGMDEDSVEEPASAPIATPMIAPLETAHTPAKPPEAVDAFPPVDSPPRSAPPVPSRPPQEVSPKPNKPTIAQAAQTKPDTASQGASKKPTPSQDIQSDQAKHPGPQARGSWWSRVKKVGGQLVTEVMDFS